VDAVTATQRLLDFAAAPHRLSGDVRDAARMLLTDTLAVGVAGSTAPGADGVLAAGIGWGKDGECRVLGRSQRLAAPTAAFVNGFQIHCLEWDAVHEPAVVHALSVVTAALFAVIDRRGGCEPAEAIEALCVGVDIACGLGIAATSGLRFFRPATAGVIGAALACARVDGLPRERFADVLGLAYSQAAGTMQAHVEGSIALPLQIAAAARAAVTALDLATFDLSGPHDALEGPFGYFQLFDEGTLDTYARDLGKVWRIAEISVKPYPSGRASHAVLSTLANLQTTHGFGAGDVETITAHVPPLVHRLVGRPWIDGMTAAYARLCLPFLVTLMLTDHRIDPRRFDDATFGVSLLRSIGDDLRVVLDGNLDPNALSPQRLEVELVDGRHFNVEIPHTLGHPAKPLSPAQRDAKLALCAELAAEPVADTRLFEQPDRYLASEAA
jgi:2-methylcitrate dehydratase PrpD